MNDLRDVVFALAVQVHLAQQGINARPRPKSWQVHVRVRKFRQSHGARKTNGSGSIVSADADGCLCCRLLVAGDKRQTRAIKAVITSRVHLVKVAVFGRRQMQILDTQTADIFEEDFESGGDVLGLACSCEVAMTGLS